MKAFSISEGWTVSNSVWFLKCMNKTSLGISFMLLSLKTLSIIVASLSIKLRTFYHQAFTFNFLLFFAFFFIFFFAFKFLFFFAIFLVFLYGFWGQPSDLFFCLVIGVLSSSEKSELSFLLNYRESDSSSKLSLLELELK